MHSCQTTSTSQLSNGAFTSAHISASATIAASAAARRASSYTAVAQNVRYSRHLVPRIEARPRGEIRAMGSVGIKGDWLEVLSGRACDGPREQLYLRVERR